jgi:hypothetical protein
LHAVPPRQLEEEEEKISKKIFVCAEKKQMITIPLFPLLVSFFSNVSLF